MEQTCYKESLATHYLTQQYPIAMSNQTLFKILWRGSRLYWIKHGARQRDRDRQDSEHSLEVSSRQQRNIVCAPPILLARVIHSEPLC